MPNVTGVRMWVRRVLLAFPVAALALLSGYVVANWNRLPNTVASHFDTAGVANGWTSKDSFASGALLATALLVVLIYVAASLSIVTGLSPASFSAGFLYFILAIISTAFWLVLHANVHHVTLASTEVLPGAVCGLVCALLAVWSLR